MKVTIVKEFLFDAAHYLPEHPGQCKNVHGHTYRLQIGLKGYVDETTGMVMDFGDVKNLVAEYVDELDHSLLNEVEKDNFPHHSPTAENMVIWYHSVLSTKLRILKGYSVELVMIKLWETPTSFAAWTA